MIRSIPLHWKHDKFVWLLILATLLLCRPALLTFEGVQNYSYLHSIAYDRDLDFSNQYLYFLEKTRWYSEQQLANDPTTGLPLNRLGIGPSLMWVPFVMPVYLVEHLFLNSDGYSTAARTALSLATGFYGVLGLLLTYINLTQLFGRGAARFATTLIWLASPLVYYLHFDTGSEHALSFALFAIILYGTLKTDRGPVAGLIYGLSIGLLLSMRMGHLLVLLPVLGLEIYRFHRSDRRFDTLAWSTLSLTLIGFLIPATLQVAVWKTLHGDQWLQQILTMPTAAFNILQPNHLTEVLFSPHHGLFYWHPLLLLCVGGWFHPRADIRTKTASLLLFVAVWWWTGSSTQWWAGTSFGHRMFLVILPCFALGAATVHEYQPRLRPVLHCLLAIATIWNLIILYQFETRKISQRDPVRWLQMLPK